MRRRHIDEDETPAVTRRRNKAADSRHGFGSPLGMELTDRAAEEDQVDRQQQQQPQQRQFVRNSPPQEYQSMQALADLATPHRPIDTMSTESETPTPPALTQQGGDRPTPQDVFDQLVRVNNNRGTTPASPPRDTPAVGAIRPPPYTARRKKAAEQQQQQGVTFQPGTSVRHYVASPPRPTSGSLSTPTFRPNSYASPMALQALRSPAELIPPRTGQSFGSIDPIQMGTPSTGGSGFPSRLSDVTMTPDNRGRTNNYPDPNNDSASDSDTSVKEPFSDQVKSLNKLLLSTDKRLGTLGITNWSPASKDNDDLTQEEEDLEEIRRQLQAELSMVDYSVLKDDSSPATSTSGSRRRFPDAFPDDELQLSPIIASRFSTPDQSKAATPQRSPALNIMAASTVERRTIVSPHDGSSSLSASNTTPTSATLNESRTSSQVQSFSSMSKQSSAVNKRRVSPPTDTTSHSRKSQSSSKENDGSPTQQQQQKKKSLPSKVLVPTQQAQRQQQQRAGDGDSARKASPPPTTTQKASRRKESKQKIASLVPTESAVAHQEMEKDAATEVSHDVSHQSSSSGSSGRSSKSLLERFGLRKLGASPVSKPGESDRAERERTGGNAADTGGYESSSSVPSTGYGDAVSTSASEDSSFYFEDRHGTEPLLSPKETPLSKTIRRFEKQIDVDDNDEDPSPKSEQGRKSSKTVRREIAPEPPMTDIRLEDTKQAPPTKMESSFGGTSRAHGVLNALDSLFRSGAEKKKSTPSNINLLPKTVERSDTASSIGANSLAFPSDEREYPRKNLSSQQNVAQPNTQSSLFAASVAFPNDDRDNLSGGRPPAKPKAVGRLGSQSSIGSKTFPSDERGHGRENLSIKTGGRLASQSSVMTSTAQFTSDESRSSKRKKEAVILETKRRPSDFSSPEKDQRGELEIALTPDNQNTSKKDSNWLLQNIGSIGSASGRSLSPIVHEDDDKDHFTEIGISSSDSATKALFSSSGEEDSTFVFDPSRLPGSSSDDTDRRKKNESFTDIPKKRAPSTCRRFCWLLILLFGAGLSIGIALYLSLGRTEQTPSPTASPTISPMPSATPLKAPSPSPTATSEPAMPFPTRSPTIAPSDGPTKFIISFESVYEIIVWNGEIDDVPPESYENDLIRSMDRLLEKISEKFRSDPNKMLRRRLQVALLPSSINGITPTKCPKSNDSLDRCEKVFAWITLEDAEDSWTDFKLDLELAIAIGQLQFELNQVNPESPVSILDLVEEPSPTSSPIELSSLVPTQTPPPTEFAPVPTQTSTPIEFDLLVFLMEKSFDDGEALMNEDSPQYQAFLWLSENARVADYSEDRLLQRYALATFYFSTHGENWFFQELWLSNANECLWYSRSSKSCNEGGQMQNLELDYNNVNGVLPPELGLLSNSLERLVLRGGPASFSGGIIPSELGLLTAMTHFFIRGNLYTGSIPTELGRWTSLQQFDVSRNNLSGPIPTEFGALGELNILDTSTNKLTGLIPTELGRLERCQRLNVESNMLTGPIPSEIGSMRRLQSFHGGSNMFTSMPTEIGQLTFLDTLSLYENEIAGRIPTEISRMRRLLLLELGNNALTGPIPSQLGSLFDMRDRIDLSYNHLTGSLPSELGNLDRLRALQLEHNKLTGTIPSAIAGLVRLTTIRIDANDFTGVIPTEVCSVFNITYPAFSADCSEFLGNCRCCTTCCVDDGACECRYIGTPQEFLCFQQKKAI